MTKKNMRLDREPFRLRPVGKDYLWGGNRLNDDFAKGIDMDPLAETWECSTHQDGLSIVDSGEFRGMTLKGVLTVHPDFLGSHPGLNGFDEGQLPVLIKFIDAKQDLSVQVHPTDEYARINENGQHGKTELWYILDADQGSRIAYGLLRDVSREKLKKSIEDQTIEKLLQYVPVQKNDVFYVEAGTVHAIGKGVLLAEIQENSNLTYRLYDYNRIDKNGNKRELHINKAVDVANAKLALQPKQPLRVLRYRPGCAEELLYRCEYFQVERMLINTERIRDMVRVQTDSTSFGVLLCIDGCGTMVWNGQQITIFRGDCIFIPAKSTKIKLHGMMQLLKVKC